MCFILVSVWILSLQISDGTIILENFNYTSNERYLIIDLSIFNDSHGSIFYNLNKTFKTNLVLKTTVKICCKIFNWKYCKHFNYFKDLIALYRAEENSNIYEKFIYFAKDNCKKSNNIFGNFLERVMWNDYAKYVFRNNSNCPFTQVCSYILFRPILTRFIKICVI